MHYISEYYYIAMTNHGDKVTARCDNDVEFEKVVRVFNRDIENTTKALESIKYGVYSDFVIIFNCVEMCASAFSFARILFFCTDEQLIELALKLKRMKEIEQEALVLMNVLTPIEGVRVAHRYHVENGTA